MHEDLKKQKRLGPLDHPSIMLVSNVNEHTMAAQKPRWAAS